ncbi:MAG: FtsW/RodA/SpoVE family cell cycle protein [Planctomycetota bacterium]|jgi:cell division protein FtsW
MFIDAFTNKEEIDRSSRWIFGLVMALLMVGLVMVFSAKTVKSARLAGEPMAPLLSHAVKVAIGLFGMLLMMRFDYRALGRHYGKIFCIMVIALAGLFLFGREINGACRWYRFMGITFQPSEYAKLGLIIVLAGLIVRAGERIESFIHGTLPSLLVIGTVCLLILMEPDFGTTAITGGLALTLLVIGGVRKRHFFLLSAAGAPLLLLYAFNNLDYVIVRLEKFFNRPLGGHVDFSLMAMASGGPVGKGLGASHLKLNFIPECESDFIFSIIGEEMGFLGTALVLLLYVGLLYFGIKILLGIRNRFGFIMATGILLLISVQALVNMAVVVGMAPTKGLPLPFISSGGSSLIALMMGVGLFLNIARNPDLSSEKIRDDFFDIWMKRLVSPITQTIRRSVK